MISYPEWYTIPAVKFQIIKYTYNRETAIIKPNYLDAKFRSVRMMRVHNVSHLDAWMKSMHIFDSQKLYNLYVSLAKYKEGIPYSTLKLAERDFTDWKINHWKEMVSYDFLIDIDAGNLNEMDFAYYSAKEVKKFFDSCGTPYYLRFSGMGFHFIVPYDYFSHLNLSFDHTVENSIYRFFNGIAEKLHNRFSEMIDVRIYDSRRVIKIPFSLALYDDRVHLCKPFESDDDFNGFRLKNMIPAYHAHHVREMYEKLFNENGNVLKLLKELKIQF